MKPLFLQDLFIIILLTKRRSRKFYFTAIFQTRFLYEFIFHMHDTFSVYLIPLHLVATKYVVKSYIACYITLHGTESLIR
jgi:hypothetical protein